MRSDFFCTKGLVIHLEQSGLGCNGWGVRVRVSGLARTQGPRMAVPAKLGGTPLLPNSSARCSARACQVTEKSHHAPVKLLLAFQN
jgi:hypothetical protein